MVFKPKEIKLAAKAKKPAQAAVVSMNVAETVATTQSPLKLA